jgi:hypothetical protein
MPSKSFSFILSSDEFSKVWQTKLSVFSFPIQYKKKFKVGDVFHVSDEKQSQFMSGVLVDLQEDEDSYFLFIEFEIYFNQSR